MDALSDLLRAVQLSGAVFLNGEFKSPWCLISEADAELRAAFLPRADRVVSYHLITEGVCWARLVDGTGPGLRVDTGELLVVPQGEPHVLGSDLRLQPLPSAPLVYDMLRNSPGEVMRVSYGGGGETTRMVCGFLGFDDTMGNPLLTSLPRLFKVGLGSGLESAWLASALAFATSEAAEPRAGTATVLAKLSELLFVQAVRRCIDTLPDNESGWLAALRDRYVGRALSRMHARPAYPWTVDELAGNVGLSRSALAQRFTDLLGQPPMQYLAHWRLRSAAAELRSGNRSISEVAGAVGYDSEAAFSRAFKREFGLPPASWRRNHIDAAQAPAAAAH
ncbi:AraC-containing protein [Cupriavidus necator]|uniref:AraC family transcriptional regulator n=1 Tax=Cupriavidus necator (strain ATCC 17699 / DSM 428 / KCTC 22496 / NCIMB 10442 / H16 / Stanier 337) TaxID=381666 RepID=Q0K2P6_CUPNH|nr:MULTISPECIES: AraC family transcriptional regulator [Cupriavidus]EON21032.1 AraC family transcriptional regulator [Cupriavidus sp. GA3-3]KUE85298.1 AraC family transcriptional regulator [Cupriavidus necator]QCC03621.1 AraC family transcriptional regulator [Cupriavidus necator H16]QQB80675.1 AraC family transcriptional regulator [Cupriavidus necator]WKA44964.1 AraC family transcriptional regulator [Cupriavidus necator]